jgi:hypothetical protein
MRGRSMGCGEEEPYFGVYSPLPGPALTARVGASIRLPTDTTTSTTGKRMIIYDSNRKSIVVLEI